MVIGSLTQDVADEIARTPWYGFVDALARAEALNILQRGHCEIEVRTIHAICA